METKKQKKTDKRYENIEMSECDAGLGRMRMMTQIYTLEISVQRRFPCSTVGERPVFVKMYIRPPRRLTNK